MGCLKHRATTQFLTQLHDVSSKYFKMQVMRSTRLCCSWPWTRIVDVWLDVSQSRFNPDVATLGRQLVAELSRYICHLQYFAVRFRWWPPPLAHLPCDILGPILASHAAHFVGNLGCWCGGFGCWQARRDVKCQSVWRPWQYPLYLKASSSPPLVLCCLSCDPPSTPSPLYLPNTFPARLSPPALSFNPLALSRPSLTPFRSNRGVETELPAVQSSCLLNLLALSRESVTFVHSSWLWPSNSPAKSFH